MMSLTLVLLFGHSPPVYLYLEIVLFVLSCRLVADLLFTQFALPHPVSPFWRQVLLLSYPLNANHE